MIAADGNADGSINSDDLDPLWSDNAGLKGYYSSDYNLDTQTNNPDKNEYWLPNVGTGSQVPE